MKKKRIEDELLLKQWPEPAVFQDNSVLVLTGPTAGGKSAVAMRLASELNAEIVSCDSMQIYKHLDIGTAKPSLDDQAQIPHYLLDICSVEENFSVARYVSLAKASFASIINKGKLPLLVGGTTLYVSALVESMQFPKENADAQLKEILAKEAAELGSAHMYERLLELDPVYAASVHPNNVKRVLRALERIISSKSVSLELDNANSLSRPEYDYRVFCISKPRETLYERINLRVDVMLKEGLLDEARWLLEQNLDESNTAMQAIGYKELFPYLKGEQSLEEGIERLKVNTRQYAKRQLSWYRGKPWAWWLFPENETEAVQLILKQIFK